MLERLAEDVSCYALEFTAQVSTAPWRETHIYTAPAHLRLILEQFAANEGSLPTRVALSWATQLVAEIVQRGVVVHRLDLRHFLRAHPPEGPSFLLDDQPRCLALIDEATESGDDQEVLDDVRLALEWHPLSHELAPLVDPLLEPGQCTTLRGAGVSRVLRFGSFNNERSEGPLPASFEDDGEDLSDESDD